MCGDTTTIFGLGGARDHLNAMLEELGNAVNQRKKKAFSLARYDRDLIPENIEQPHISKTQNLRHQ
jgi:hypothetical protein